MISFALVDLLYLFNIVSIDRLTEINYNINYGTFILYENFTETTYMIEK